eukprot:Opistho-2@69229
MAVKLSARVPSKSNSAAVNGMGFARGQSGGGYGPRPAGLWYQQGPPREPTMTEAVPPPVADPPDSGPPPSPEQVFREYAPRIYHLARRMLGNDADAEDVTQDVLVQVVRKLGTFRGDAQLGTWLHRVTVNAALAYRQKRTNRQKRETHEAD